MKEQNDVVLYNRIKERDKKALELLLLKKLLKKYLLSCGEKREFTAMKKGSFHHGCLRLQETPRLIW